MHYPLHRTRAVARRVRRGSASCRLLHLLPLQVLPPLLLLLLLPLLLRARGAAQRQQARARHTRAHARRSHLGCPPPRHRAPRAGQVRRCRSVTSETQHYRVCFERATGPVVTTHHT